MLVTHSIKWKQRDQNQIKATILIKSGHMTACCQTEVAPGTMITLTVSFSSVEKTLLFLVHSH